MTRRLTAHAPDGALRQRQFAPLVMRRRWVGKASEEDSIKEMKGFSGPVVQHCLR